MRIHIISAHLTYPGWTEGALNRAMADRATKHLRAGGHDVTETRVEDGYDPEAEVQRHLEADLVILQTPINWFGAPWIHKRYIDAVFNAGLHSTEFLDNDGRTRADPSRQYGTGGHLHGRGFLVAATWNAPSESFGNPDSVLFAGKGVDDLLLGITAAYRFVGFTVLESYGIHDIFRAADIAERLEGYGPHLDRQLAMLGDGASVQSSPRRRSEASGSR
ncbi:modulator of drug activity B [Rathayibacter oskolensis]|uniref:Modulator of drug activity B n=1 Tax=Rathayibacter oskolensis TaxID=1891671 RepID=A0A1X7PJD4_9MICO|nr:NAD(P)H-dependent oxidoreductase [Rathayibacter oskolensis]SMH51033.1 modulator of drug activity B [Rathayibacter oskolensis]